MSLKHMPKKQVKEQVLTILSDGEIKTFRALCAAIDASEVSVRMAIDRLLIKDKIERIKQGHYRILKRYKTP